MKYAVASALAAVVVACSGPSDNPPSDGNILRPDADNDADFDGVKDDVDNCPFSNNSFQGNEDGDKFGDACDPCPPVADDNPVDGDGDGVADACDPKKILIGERVAFFEGFHQGAPQGWDEAGTWSTSMDQLRGSSAGAGHYSLIITERTRETLTASITVMSVVGAGSEAGLVDRKVPNSATGIACTLTQTAGTPEVTVYDRANPAGAQKTPFELMIGQTYIMTLQRENQDYTCTATRGAATAFAMKTFSGFPNPYQSGFVLTGANIRVNWFLLVESQ